MKNRNTLLSEYRKNLITRTSNKMLSNKSLGKISQIEFLSAKTKGLLKTEFRFNTKKTAEAISDKLYGMSSISSDEIKHFDNFQNGESVKDLLQRLHGLALSSITDINQFIDDHFDDEPDHEFEIPTRASQYGIKDKIINLVIEIQNDFIKNILGKFDEEISNQFIKERNQLSLKRNRSQLLKEQIFLACNLIDKQLANGKKPAEMKSPSNSVNVEYLTPKNQKRSIDFISEDTAILFNGLMDQKNGSQLFERIEDSRLVFSTILLPNLPATIKTDKDVKAIHSIITRFYSLSNEFLWFAVDSKSSLAGKIIVGMVYDALHLISNKYVGNTKALESLKTVYPGEQFKGKIAEMIKAVYNDILQTYKSSQLFERIEDSRLAFSTILLSNLPATIKTDNDVKAIHSIISQFYSLSNEFLWFAVDSKSSLAGKKIVGMVYDALHLISNKYVGNTKALESIKTVYPGEQFDGKIAEMIKAVYTDILQTYKSRKSQIVEVAFISDATAMSLATLCDEKNKGGKFLIEKMEELRGFFSQKLALNLPAGISTISDVKALTNITNQFCEISTSILDGIAEYKSDPANKVILQMVDDALQWMLNKYLGENSDISGACKIIASISQSPSKIITEAIEKFNNKLMERSNLLAVEKTSTNPQSFLNRSSEGISDVTFDGERRPPSPVQRSQG